MRIFGSKKEPQRYYLLPGMGDQARRRKVVEMLGWGILAGAITSLLVAIVLYLLSQFRPDTL